MDTPPSPHPPEKAAADAVKLRQAREAELKRNREIGHLLKSGSFHQHQARRSMPHVRGR